jgi:hypothetical protein
MIILLNSLVYLINQLINNNNNNKFISNLINSYQNSVPVWYILKYSSMLHEHLLEFQYLGSTHSSLGSWIILHWFQRNWSGKRSPKSCPHSLTGISSSYIIQNYQVFKMFLSHRQTELVVFISSIDAIFLKKVTLGRQKNILLYIYIYIYKTTQCPSLCYNLLWGLGLSIGSHILHLSPPVFLTPIRPCTVGSTETASCPVHYDSSLW